MLVCQPAHNNNNVNMLMFSMQTNLQILVKLQRITKVIKIHCLGTMHIFFMAVHPKVLVTFHSKTVGCNIFATTKASIKGLSSYTTQGEK